MFSFKNLKNPREAALFLRIGIGLVFIYAGIGLFTNQETWMNYVPEFINGILPIKTFSILFGLFETILGFLILSGIKIYIFSFISFLNLLLIIIFVGIYDSTFQNFGILMASLSLFLLSDDNKQKVQ